MLTTFARSLFSQQRVAGGAAVLAVTQLGASIAGLVRDRVLAATFPPGFDTLDVVSVYITAFRPSDLLFQFFVMSAFSVALVPLLAGHLAAGRREEMNRLLTSTIIVGSFFFGLLALVLALALPRLAPFLVDFTGRRLELYVHFARLACFTNFLFVAGNAFGQYLVTRQTYWAYGIAPILYTLGTIAGALWLTPIVGPYGPIYGTVLGALVYVWVRSGAAIFQGFSFRMDLRSLLHPSTHSASSPKGTPSGSGQVPELLEMGWLMLPRMVALGALQLELLLFDKLASGLPLGSVTVNAYARNFQSVLVGVTGIALAQSAYSLLSQAVARGDLQRFWSTIRKGTLLTLGLTIPGAIALVLLARVAASLVHLEQPEIIAAFLVTLGIYAFSVPFESLNHLFLRGSYATKHTGIPAILSVLNGVVAIGISWLLAPRYGIAALAAGFLAGQVIEMVFLAVFLRFRVRG